MRRGLLTGLVGAALSVALLASAGLAVGAKTHRLLLPAPEQLAELRRAGAGSSS